MIDGHTSTVGFDTFCPMQMQRYHSDGEIIGTSEYTESMNLFLVAHSQVLGASIYIQPIYSQLLTVFFHFIGNIIYVLESKCLGNMMVVRIVSRCTETLSSCNTRCQLFSEFRCIKNSPYPACKDFITLLIPFIRASKNGRTQ
jgi:hypothetical protein